jgi:NAD(P)-dependent dehydrogenase (short-subunit alcohol dehydrogenase family)
MKTVVMTGGTSGLGEYAAQQIFQTQGIRLLLGARAAVSSKIETLPLDLARLKSVREFAEAVTEKLGDAPIDVLVLNAGTQFGNVNQRTEDGFETTFAVNQLAHYLLLRLLLPKLAPDAVVVITTSDTHDPSINPMAPRQLDPEQSAHPPARGGLTAGFRAYANSKLCNLLTARGLVAYSDARTRTLRVVAYNPGLTPGTSLFRSWPLWIRMLMGLAAIVRPLARLNTIAQAGGSLADLALGRVVPPAGRIYASLVKGRLTWPDPSELARNDLAMLTLWRNSARMVGLADSP